MKTESTSPVYDRNVQGDTAIDRRAALCLGASLFLSATLPALAPGEEKETTPGVVEAKCMFHSLTGSPVIGTLTQIDKDTATIVQDGLSQQLALDTILSIEVVTTDLNEMRFSPTARLLDGSKLSIKDVVLTGKNLSVIPLASDTTVVANQRHTGIQSLQFTDIPDAVWPAWSAIASRKEQFQDVLVIYNTETKTLDWIEGYVSAISAKSVTFHVDDTPYEVSRQRPHKVIAGIFFAQRGEQKMPAAIGTLNTTDGASLAFSDLSFRDKMLHVQGVSGFTLQTPLDCITSVDLSHGKVFPIDSLQVTNLKYAPGVTGSFERRQRPALNQSALGGPLKVGSEVYRHGLSIQSGTEVTFRLPHATNWFRTIAAIDPAVQTDAKVILRILGQNRDGMKEIGRYTIQTDSEPTTINAAISGMTRLQLMVEPGPDLSFGDILNLANAEVRK